MNRNIETLSDGHTGPSESGSPAMLWTIFLPSGYLYQIAESFRRFGITPSTTSLLAIKVSTSPSVNVGAVERHLLESIEGTSLPFDDSEIARFTDMAKVQKIYKLAGVVRGSESCNSKKMKVEQEKKEGIDNTSSTSRKEDAERKRLESLVLGLMALRGAT